MRLLLFLLAALLAVQPAQAPSSNRVIEVKDGDIIVVRDRAAVRVVHRTDAEVRVIYNAAQRWLVVLADQAAAGTGGGSVDLTYTFDDVEGTWPLGERWQGRASLDEYSVVGQGMNAGIGLNTSNGLVQILSSAPPVRDTRRIFEDPAAVAILTFRGFGRSGGGNQSFDAAEQTQTANAARHASGVASGTSIRTGIDFRVGTAPDPPGGYPAPMAPVRGGGNIRTPTRLEHAEPVLPETARQAGIRGVVILEITIGPDGRVSDAKVLRSIPLLDAAALDAVRKWRYEPTLLNGAPVPVIMTVTVNFP
jgi:TonB family protein